MKLSMKPLQLLASLLLLTPSSATEATATATTSPFPASVGENILNSTRQSNANPLSFVSIAGDVLGQIANNVFGIFEKEVDQREKWVDETVRRVSEQEAGRNVLVFHNNASVRHLQGYVRHEHFETTRFWNLASYGWEIYAFDRGTSQLAGDDARSEWGYNASCMDNRASSLGGTYIEFCDSKTGQGPDKGAAGSTSTRNDGAPLATMRPGAAAMAVGAAGLAALCLALR
ncbi:hypothetical protein PG991_011878 [Apiospora marii]|uniref:Uncharacterized protein n=1 Tax=Apiospora marii TaxID=335849 RepID=A0ABR1RFB2_9PEZI